MAKKQNYSHSIECHGNSLLLSHKKMVMCRECKTKYGLAPNGAVIVEKPVRSFKKSGATHFRSGKEIVMEASLFLSLLMVVWMWNMITNRRLDPWGVVACVVVWVWTYLLITKPKSKRSKR